MKKSAARKEIEHTTKLFAATKATIDTFTKTTPRLAGLFNEKAAPDVLQKARAHADAARNAYIESMLQDTDEQKVSFVNKANIENILSYETVFSVLGPELTAQEEAELAKLFNKVLSQKIHAGEAYAKTLDVIGAPHLSALVTKALSQ